MSNVGSLKLTRMPFGVKKSADLMLHIPLRDRGMAICKLEVNIY